jgi:hypothetical protein
MNALLPVWPWCSLQNRKNSWHCNDWLKLAVNAASKRVDVANAVEISEMFNIIKDGHFCSVPHNTIPPFL